MIAPPSKILTAELSPESAPRGRSPWFARVPAGTAGPRATAQPAWRAPRDPCSVRGPEQHSRRSSETVEQRRGPNRAVSVMNMRRAPEQVGETAAPEQAKDHQCDRSAARPPGRGSRPPDRGQVCPGSSLLLRGADYRARSMTRSGAWLNRSVVTAE